MFDANKHIEVTVRDGKAKKCVVRFPTDEEWTEHARHTKLVQKSLGGGKTKPVLQTEHRHDKALFDAIRQDHGEDDFGEDAAASVIERINRTRVTDICEDGGRYVITMQAYGTEDEVTILLNEPTKKQQRKYASQSLEPVYGNRFSETRFNLAPAGWLYGELEPETSDYPNGVPITHKYAAIEAVMEEIRRLEDDAPEV